MRRFLYIINPAGHGGTGLQVWEEFQSLWSEPIDPSDVVVTKRAGQAREIAASREGYDTLVAIGGDGTANEVASGIQDRGDGSLRLAIVPAGTGNDIARSVGIRSVEDAVSALRSGEDAAHDVVHVDFATEGAPQRGYSFLQAVVGFSALPGVKPWMKRLLGPTLAYYLGTVVQIVRYKPPLMTIEAGGQTHSGAVWMVVVGNAEWTSGGSMCLSPGARTDDGELNVSVIRKQRSKLEMTRKMMPKISTGEHVHLPEVDYFKATRVEVRSSPPAVLDLDGDIVGTTPVAFTVRPRALRILSARAAS